MIKGTRDHLRDNNESYGEHLKFAVTVGMLAIGAGLACLIHALVPALCTTTASRTIRHLTTLLAQRDQLTETRAEASELLAFLFLLMLSAAVVAPMWLLPVPNVLRFVYAGLALAIPLTLLITNRELASRDDDVPAGAAVAVAAH
jgi:hypothetical protein